MTTPRKPIPYAAAYAIDDALMEASRALHLLDPVVSDPYKTHSVNELKDLNSASYRSFFIIIDRLKSIRTAEKGAE